MYLLYCLPICFSSPFYIYPNPHSLSRSSPPKKMMNPPPPPLLWTPEIPDPEHPRGWFSARGVAPGELQEPSPKPSWRPPRDPPHSHSARPRPRPTRSPLVTEVAQPLSRAPRPCGSGLGRTSCAHIRSWSPSPSASRTGTTRTAGLSASAPCPHVPRAGALCGVWGGGGGHSHRRVGGRGRVLFCDAESGAVDGGAPRLANLGWWQSRTPRTRQTVNAQNTSSVSLGYPLPKWQQHIVKHTAQEEAVGPPLAGQVPMPPPPPHRLWRMRRTVPQDPDLLRWAPAAKAVGGVGGGGYKTVAAAVRVGLTEQAAPGGGGGRPLLLWPPSSRLPGRSIERGIASRTFCERGATAAGTSLACAFGAPASASG